jgi:hypothetical protein
VVLVLTSAFVLYAVEAEIGRSCVTTRQRQSTLDGKVYTIYIYNFLYTIYNIYYYY